MRRVLAVGWIGAFVFAAAVYPVVGIISSTAVEAWPLDAFPREKVEVNRDPLMISLPKKDDPKYAAAVMRLYGIPGTEPLRYVFVSRERIFHPEELPSLSLLPVNLQAGDQPPLQLQTVTWAAPLAAGTAAVVGILLLGVWFMVRRKPASDPRTRAGL